MPASVMNEDKKKLLLEAGVFFGIVVGGFGVVVLSIAVFLYLRDSSSSVRQYNELREIAKRFEIIGASESPPSAWEMDSADTIYDVENVVYAAVGGLSEFDLKMRMINPDFIAWLVIDGTNISYPVVRGKDNEQYLYTTFFGEFNRFGTPFMDYRNVGSFVPHIIIYGHNTRHGDMFSQLHLMLDERFLADASVIKLIVNGRVVEFDIFRAVHTDIHDFAYFLDFSHADAFGAFLERIGAPPDAAQILTLSTCVRGPDDDERMIVQAVLRK